MTTVDIIIFTNW